MALSLADSVVGANASPPAPVAFTSSPHAGDALVCFVSLSGSPSAGTPTPSNVTVLDTVNGSYTPAGYVWDATNAKWISWHFVTATTTIPTVSASLSVNRTGTLTIGRFTGFQGVPRADAAIANSATGIGTAASISAISLQANEVMLIGATSGSFFGSAATGWPSLVVGNQNSAYAVEANSGTANNYSNTLNASSYWDLLLVGIYDFIAPQAPVPHASPSVNCPF